MAKKFSKHAQQMLNRNPNVVKCSEGKIVFKEQFALKICDALKRGDDPFQIFEDEGLPVKILGKARINGVIGLWKSKYELEDLPRRKKKELVIREKESAAERKERHLQEAIKLVDHHIAYPETLSLSADTDHDILVLSAIKHVYEEEAQVILKDLCAHYGYQYSRYYSFLQSIKPKETTFVNVLNPHRKNK